MPKSDNAQALRLYASLEKNIGPKAAEDFEARFPLSKSADFKKKFIWAKVICACLEEAYSEQDIKAIRTGCACEPGGKAEKAKRLYEKSADYDEFCQRFNAEYAPENSLTHEGGSLLFSYPACYCSCVKRGDGDVPVTWCLCTLGYTQKLFAYALSRDVDAVLLESIKTGGQRCLMRVTAR